MRKRFTLLCPPIQKSWDAHMRVIWLKLRQNHHTVGRVGCLPAGARCVFIQSNFGLLTNRFDGIFFISLKKHNKIS